MLIERVCLSSWGRTLHGLKHLDLCDINRQNFTENCYNFFNVSFWQHENDIAADRLLSIKHELSESQKCWNMVSMNPKQIIWQLLSCYFNRVTVCMCHFPAEFQSLTTQTSLHLHVAVKSNLDLLSELEWWVVVGKWHVEKMALIWFFFHAGYIEEACIIPCPSDCKLSEWSNWSRCSKSCGSGVKVRSKWLREKPYNGGRPCPKLDHVNQVFSTTDFN